MEEGVRGPPLFTRSAAIERASIEPLCIKEKEIQAFHLFCFSIPLATRKKEKTKSARAIE
jgi:hypothetical protein